MIGCLRTYVHKQPIIALYFESENVLKFYNLEARVYLCYLIQAITRGLFIGCIGTRQNGHQVMSVFSQSDVIM